MNELKHGLAVVAAVSVNKPRECRKSRTMEKNRLPKTLPKASKNLQEVGSRLQKASNILRKKREKPSDSAQRAQSIFTYQRNNGVPGFHPVDRSACRCYCNLSETNYFPSVSDEPFRPFLHMLLKISHL